MAKKEAAKAEINGISAEIDVTKYSEEDQNKIAALLADARRAVENAESVEDVEQAVATLRAELEKVQPATETKSGCMATTGAEGPAFFLILLVVAGLCVPVVKKKN